MIDLDASTDAIQAHTASSSNETKAMATAQTAQTAQPLRQMPAVWATVTKDKAEKKRPASTAPLENAEDRWNPSERARTAVDLEGDGGHPCGCAPPQGVDPESNQPNQPFFARVRALCVPRGTSHRDEFT